MNLEQLNSARAVLRSKAETRLGKKEEDLERMSQDALRPSVRDQHSDQADVPMQNVQFGLTQEELEVVGSERDSFDFARIGYLTLNEEGRILQANLTSMVMLGVKSIRNRPLSCFVFGQDVNSYHLWWRNLFQSGTNLSCELRLLPVNGQLFHARLQAVQASEEGSHVCRLAISDITKQKLAEEALRTSESTLRSFYESAPLMMGVVEVLADNSDIIHTYDNPATDRFFGRAPGSTAGQSALGMGAPEEAVRRWIEHYRLSEHEGKPVQFGYWHPLKSGAVWLSAVVARIGPGDSGRTRFSYAVVDGTERKRVEEALRSSEERLTLATLGGDLGIWDWDIEHDKACLSGKYYEMTGYQEGEVQPNLEFLRGLVHPEDSATVESTMAAHLRGESEYCVIEYRMRRKTCEYRWIRGVGKVVARDEQGRPLRMAGVIADITMQKKADAALREQLAYASRVSTMGELACSIAHELNQPLSAILCNVDTAEAYLNQSTPALDQMRDILSDIREANQRAGEVIQTMRTLLTKHEIDHQPIEINLMAEEVLRFVKEDAISRKIGIATELSPQLPAIHGNRVQLQQLVLNLILNAMDAMAQQPAEQRHLTVATRLATDGGVEVSVSDSGCGIEPSDLPRLLQPFFTTKKSGLGIGLSVAEKIVAAHRGRIWAENLPAGGAVFRVVLPAVNTVD